jgi:hypothetical protein
LRIFGPRKDEVTGEWRRLHIKQVYDCTSHEILVGCSNQENKMCAECSTYWGEERCMQGLVRKPEENRPRGRPRLRWESNNKMNLDKAGW